MTFPTYPERTTQAIEARKREIKRLEKRLEEAEKVIETAEEFCFRTVTPIGACFPPFANLCTALLMYRKPKTEELMNQLAETMQKVKATHRHPVYDKFGVQVAIEDCREYDSCPGYTSDVEGVDP